MSYRGKHEKKKVNRHNVVDWQTVLVGGLVDLLVGEILMLIQWLLDT